MGLMRLSGLGFKERENIMVVLSMRVIVLKAVGVENKR